MRNIQKALESHFSLHDVDEILHLLQKYREYEHKQEHYSEDDFANFLKEM